ncbi:MAG: hypothetical protein ACRC9Z_02295 [Weissella confusa]
MAQLLQNNWVHIVGGVVSADLDMSANQIVGKLRLNFGEDYEMNASYVVICFGGKESLSTPNFQTFGEVNVHNFENLIGKSVEVTGFMKFNPTKLNKPTIIFIAQSIAMHE